MKELHEILAAFQKVVSGQEVAVLATLVDIQGSSYRRLGAKMLVTSQGCRVGSISGGCLEDDVCDRAIQVMRSGQSIVVEYDTKAEADIIWGLGLGCHGTLKILIERLAIDRKINPLYCIAECLQQRQVGAISTIFSVRGEVNAVVGDRLILPPDGTVVTNIADAQLSTALFQDATHAQKIGQSEVKLYTLSGGIAEVFIEAIAPPVWSIVFGAGDDAIPVVRLAKELGWQVTVVDRRSAYATSQRFPLADAVIVARAETIDQHIQPDRRTVAVVMTHNYLQDLELLKRLLPSPVRYIGVLGSRDRTQQLLQQLNQIKTLLTPDHFERLYAPVGLDIGAETPEAIAFAILAEIQAVLANRKGGFLKHRKGSIHPKSK